MLEIESLEFSFLTFSYIKTNWFNRVAANSHIKILATTRAESYSNNLTNLRFKRCELQRLTNFWKSATLQMIVQSRTKIYFNVLTQDPFAPFRLQKYFFGKGIHLWNPKNFQKNELLLRDFCHHIISASFRLSIVSCMLTTVYSSSFRGRRSINSNYL